MISSILYLGHNSINNEWSVAIVPSEQYQDELQKAMELNNSKYTTP